MKSIFKNLIYRLFNHRIMRKGEAGAVYLTYDDGPHPENTLKILDALARYKAKATFFMVGLNMEKYPEIVNAVINQGHTIGYHSYRHKRLKKKSFNEFKEDFAHVSVLSERFNYSIELYRPPFGDLSILSFCWLLLKGWKIVMWSLDCRDSFDAPEQVKANIAYDAITDGEIILLHDDYPDACNLIESTLQLYNDRQIICRKL